MYHLHFIDKESTWCLVLLLFHSPLLQNFFSHNHLSFLFIFLARLSQVSRLALAHFIFLSSVFLEQAK